MYNYKKMWMSLLVLALLIVVAFAIEQLVKGEIVKAWMLVLYAATIFFLSLYLYQKHLKDLKTIMQGRYGKP